MQRHARAGRGRRSTAGRTGSNWMFSVRDESKAFCSALKSGSAVARRARRSRRRASPTASFSARTAAASGFSFDGPVVAVAREQPHVVAVDARQHAVAVELDLVDPVVARRRAVDQRRELRRQRERQVGRLGAVGQPAWRGVALRGGASAARRLCRAVLRRLGRGLRRKPAAYLPLSTLSGSSSTTLYSAAGRAVVVALLDQQPRLLALVARGRACAPASSAPCSFSPCSSNFSLPAR